MRDFKQNSFYYLGLFVINIIVLLLVICFITYDYFYIINNPDIKYYFFDGSIISILILRRFWSPTWRTATITWITEKYHLRKWFCVLSFLSLAIVLVGTIVNIMKENDTVNAIIIVPFMALFVIGGFVIDFTRISKMVQMRKITH